MFITSCIGKRFERITSHRLAGILAQTDFDLHQFAYLKSRRTTQVVVEKVKQALIAGKNAGVVFLTLLMLLVQLTESVCCIKLQKILV